MHILVVGGGIGGLTTALSLHAVGLRERPGRGVCAGDPAARCRDQPAPPCRPRARPSSASAQSWQLLASRRRTCPTTTPTVRRSGRSRAVWRPATGGRSTRSTAAPCSSCSSTRPWNDSGLTQSVRASASMRPARSAMRPRWSRPSEARRSSRLPTSWSPRTGSSQPYVLRATPTRAPPDWNGSVLWRGTSRAEPFLSGRSMIMAGHRAQKFVAYPISAVQGDGKQLVNWIAEESLPDRHVEREDWNRRVDVETFAPRLRRVAVRLARRARAHRVGGRPSSSTPWLIDRRSTPGPRAA